MTGRRDFPNTRVKESKHSVLRSNSQRQQPNFISQASQKLNAPPRTPSSSPFVLASISEKTSAESVESALPSSSVLMSSKSGMNVDDLIQVVKQPPGAVSKGNYSARANLFSSAPLNRVGGHHRRAPPTGGRKSCNCA